MIDNIKMDKNGTINYYSLCMGRRDNHIHKILSPIINTVKKNNINSFFQLHNRISEEHQPQPVFKSSKKGSPDNDKMGATSYLFSATKNNPQQSPKTANNKMRSTFAHEFDKKPPTAHINNKKLFRVNSKIKKHLVEEINFDEIEKMLYKKRQYVTQYEHYLQLKSNNRQNKEKQIKSQNTSRSRKDNILSNQKKYEQNPVQFMYQTFSPRTHGKKKFWAYGNRKNKSLTYRQHLFDPVKGHSFSTIQK